MGEVELATNSFGQGFNVTMTQMAAAFSSLINGGYYYEPHVVKQIQDESGNVIETKDPVLLRKTISAETSEQLKEYLGAVMDYGTGKGARLKVMISARKQERLRSCPGETGSTFYPIWALLPRTIRKSLFM